jgi:hypothetical protein
MNRNVQILRIASVLSLVAIGLIAYAILYPKPLAVMAAMSIGQGLGTFGLLLYGWVILRDVRSSRVARGESERPKK